MRIARHSRRNFLKKASAYALITAVSGALKASPVQKRSNSRPNILFLFTDQQSRRAMSAYGNSFVHTPHMDSLAENGVRFENSYCTSPVCGPSRSSLVTGLMPHQTGVLYNEMGINPGIPAMGEIFREAGYHTSWAGKWHLPASYPEVRYQGGGPQYVENAAIPGFEFLPTPKGTQFRLGSQTDTRVTANAIEFLRRKHEKPFLMGVSLHNPHDICWTVREKLGRAPDHVILPPLPSNFAIDPGEPEFIAQCRRRTTYGPEMQFTKDWDENRWRVYLRSYYSLTEEVDREIGQILIALRSQGLEEDTLIVFTSDHGEGMAAHQWVVKLMLWEEVAGVPMIVSWKGVTAPGVNTAHLVSGMDVLPTLCDFAGISGIPRMTGMSMRPYVENPSARGRDYIVTQLHPDPEKKDMTARMVRTPRYKYIAFTTGDRREMLFDLEIDPGETKNLARLPQMRGILASHRRYLLEWIAGTDDRFAMPEPN